MKKNLCEGCDLCCRHIAVEIDEPETAKEFDQIRWFLLHRDVWVFIDNDDSWNLQVNTPCERLGKDGWCGDKDSRIYDGRPQICKDYSSENCEKNGDGNSFKIMWKNVGEFDDWVNDGKVV